MNIEHTVLIGLGIFSLTGWLFGILVALRGIKRTSERAWHIEKLQAQLVRENMDRMALEASNESLTKERNRLREANDRFQRQNPARLAPTAATAPVPAVRKITPSAVSAPAANAAPYSSPPSPAPVPYDPMQAMFYQSLASAPTSVPASEPSCRASSYESAGGGDFGGGGASSSWSDSSSSSDSISSSSSSSD